MELLHTHSSLTVAKKIHILLSIAKISLYAYIHTQVANYKFWQANDSVPHLLCLRLLLKGQTFLATLSLSLNARINLYYKAFLKIETDKSATS